MQKAPFEHSFFCGTSAPEGGSKAANTEQGAGEAQSQGLLPAGRGGGHGSRKEPPALDRPPRPGSHRSHPPATGSLHEGWEEQMRAGTL